MAKMTFFPVGNGDTTLIEFGDGRLMLVDYCHRVRGEDDKEPYIDLASSLSAILADLERDDIDVVVFTHRHDDHSSGAEEFFSFDHAETYQGEGCIAIRELWVPASMVLATGLEGSARVIRQEARHRIRQGSGVRVFSAPEALCDLSADLGDSRAPMAAGLDCAGRITLVWTVHY
jgi:glyoxylase-like metal-dependent hydrolase (beta-lactamase superfamily II)